MIRTEVHALGMLVDILEWDGNVDELIRFTPDQFHGVDEHGTVYMGSDRPEASRTVRLGDVLVRPAGRDDISPLMLFRDSWWARELGLLGEDDE